MKTNISELQVQWLNEYDNGLKDGAVLDLKETFDCNVGKYKKNGMPLKLKFKKNRDQFDSLSRRFGTVARSRSIN